MFIGLLLVKQNSIKMMDSTDDNNLLLFMSVKSDALWIIMEWERRDCRR